jgi:hypothetical protein
MECQEITGRSEFAHMTGAELQEEIARVVTPLGFVRAPGH